MNKIQSTIQFTKEYSDEVLRRFQWPTFFLYYKLDVSRLFYKAYSESLPDTLSKPR